MVKCRPAIGEAMWKNMADKSPIRNFITLDLKASPFRRAREIGPSVSD